MSPQIELKHIIRTCSKERLDNKKELTMFKKHMHMQEVRQESFKDCSDFMTGMSNADPGIVQKAFIVKEIEKQDNDEDCAQMATEYKQNNLLLNIRYKPSRFKRKAFQT